MTTEQLDLELARLRRRKAALDRRAQEKRATSKRAAMARQGNLGCHACPARFFRLDDWECHAAATGHDVRGNTRAATSVTASRPGVQFAADVYRPDHLEARPWAAAVAVP